MTAEIVTIITAAVVSIFMALFGYLKLRDQKRFSSIEEKGEDRRLEIVRLRQQTEDSEKSHLECLRRATILEARVKFLESLLGHEEGEKSHKVEVRP